MRPCATASRQPTYIPRVPSVPSTPADPSICFHCDPRVPYVPSPFSQGVLTCFWNLQTQDFDAMSSPFEVRCLLSHGRARVIGILRTMCHVITDVTANHRLSSRTVRVLPVRQFAVRSSLNTHTRIKCESTFAFYNYLLSHFRIFALSRFIPALVSLKHDGTKKL